MSHLVTWTEERGAWHVCGLKARGRVCLEPGAGPVPVVFHLEFGGRALKAVTFVASINLY